MKRIIGLIMLMVILLVVSPVFAQEATEEAPSDDGVIVSPNEGETTVVVQAPAEENNQWTSIISLVLSVAAFVGVAFGVFLNPNQREKAIGIAEKGGHYAWIATATINDIIPLIGGRRDIETSSDPKTLAAALRDKEMNVFISKDVDFSKVVEAYNNPSG